LQQLAPIATVKNLPAMAARIDGLTAVHDVNVTGKSRTDYSPSFQFHLTYHLKKLAPGKSLSDRDSAVGESKTAAKENTSNNGISQIRTIASQKIVDKKYSVTDGADFCQYRFDVT